MYCIGLWYRMLLTAGNVVGAGKDRRGAKTAKDRVTVGLTVNATGTDFWKPVFIGKAKRPRCFGKHWKPEQIGALYYNNETAWMRSNIWVDIMDQFNRYCYSKSNAGTDPVILLTDNCYAHCQPHNSTPWSHESLAGYRMSNVLVIYFAPNCTSKVQPLDAGCIQTIKALFRKRHMSWVLQQLGDAKERQVPAMVKCTIRQAMEWFMFAVNQCTPEAVRNCWIATKILTPAQMEDLATGVRHNNRVAFNESRANVNASVSDVLLDELNGMLSALSVGLAADVSKPVRMVDAVDLLDMPLEREVFEPPAQAAADTDEPEETVDEIEHTEDDNVAMVPLDMDVDVDEMEPERAPTLQEVRGLVEKVFLFVTENAERVNASVMVRDYNSLFAVDILREGLAAMHTSNRTRQASVREFFPPAPRPPAP